MRWKNLRRSRRQSRDCGKEYPVPQARRGDRKIAPCTAILEGVRHPIPRRCGLEEAGQLVGVPFRPGLSTALALPLALLSHVLAPLQVALLRTPFLRGCVLLVTVLPLPVTDGAGVVVELDRSRWWESCPSSGGAFAISSWLLPRSLSDLVSSLTRVRRE